ncbi:hypothetical protein HOE41_02825, partial [Candidatus Woesearchaeota archaeon]|nr:hypothetical protein [Candidatus Woesearchaeota archaeon]
SLNHTSGEDLYLRNTFTFGNTTQAATINMDGEGSGDRVSSSTSCKIYGASESYPVVITGARDFMYWDNINFKWVDFQINTSTDDRSKTITLDGTSWFRDITVDTTDIFDTGTSTLYMNNLTLVGNLTSGAGNITNNTNAQWLAHFDNADTYTWSSTNISQGNNTGSLVINAQSATDGGNNVPDGMWLFGGEGVACLFSANDTLTANLSCASLQVEAAATLVTGEYSINATGDAEVNGTLDASSGGNQWFDSLTIQATGTYTATSENTTISGVGVSSYNAVLYVGGTFDNNTGTFVFNHQDSGSYRSNLGYEESNGGQLHNVIVDTNGIQSFEANTVITGNLTVDAGTAQTNNAAWTWDITGDVVVNSGGTLGAASRSADYSFGSLTINSGGTYSATNGTTTITDENPSGYAFVNDGTFTHNSGTVTITTDANTYLDLTGSGNVYNLITNRSGRAYDWTIAATIDNDLTVTAGTLRASGVGDNLIVTGDVDITGILSDNARGVVMTFGSLTINSGGTYSATSGTTTITSEADSGYGWDNDGTFTANSGTVNFTYGTGTLLDAVGTSGTFYNLIFSGTSTTLMTDLDVEGNLTENSVGALITNANNKYINVTENVVIGGQIGDATETADWTFGSLTINSGGVYSATSGITEINNTALNTYALNNDGTLTANGGTINITSQTASQYYLDIATGSGNPYNFVVDIGGGNSLKWIFDGGVIDGNLTVQSGTFNSNADLYDLTVTGDTVVSGTLSNGGSDAMTFGSLAIKSGGTYSATSGTTTINSEDGSNHALDCDGTFTANSGNVSIETGASTIVDILCTGSLYDLDIDNTGVATYWEHDAATIANDLVITAGSFRAGTTTHDITVTGDVLVQNTGTLGIATESGARSFGSLTINSGGTYVATSGTTTLTSESGSGRVIDVDTAATYTHNNGELAITTNTATAFVSYENIFNNITINNAGSYTQMVGNVTVADTLTVNSGKDLYVGSGQDNILIIGNSTQSGSIVSTGDFIVNAYTGYTQVIKGASSAYPLVATGTNWNWDQQAPGNTLNLSNIDYQINGSTGGDGILIQLVGDTWFRNMTVSSGDALSITGSATLYTDVLDLSGNLTSGTGNITNNTNSQWLAQFDSANTYAWDSTNISKGNNTGASVINALTATDGGNNVPAAMWKFTGGTVTLDNPNTSWTVGANATFDCSATNTDVALANISLYHNNTGTFHNNGTVSVSGTSASAQFNVSTLQENGFEWYCEACDAVSCVVSSDNRTVTADTTTPTISYLADVWVDATRIGTWRDVVVNLTSSDTNNQSTFLDWNKTLVGYWSMDAVSGSTVLDNSTWQNNGTLEGGATPTQGKFGKGMKFNGDDEVIRMGEITSGHPLMLANSNITISAWFKQYSGDTYQRIVDKSTAGNSANGYGLAAHTNRDIYLLVDGSYYRTDTSAYNFGEWTHVVGVVTEDTFEIYIDGVNQTGGSWSGSAKLPPDATANLSIGSWNHADAREVNGSIDEVQIYSRALSANEIRALYDANANQYNKTWTGLTEGQSYTYTGYSVDLGANKNETAERTVTINNIPTTFTSVAMASSTAANITSDNLSVSWTDGTDGDSDTIYNITDWRVNGSSIAVLNLAFDSNRSGTTTAVIRDYSTFENNATLGNTTTGRAPAWTSSCQIGGCYEFTAAGEEKINISNTVLTGLSTVTTELWIKTSGSAQGVITGANPTYNNEYLIYDQSSLRLYVHDSNWNSGVSINNNAWRHVVFTWDGSNGTVKLFVDGVFQNSGTVNTGALTIPVNGLWLGAEQDSVGGGFQASQELVGFLDEVRIYNRSLSADQIWANYVAGNASLSVQTMVSDETGKNDVWSVSVTPNDLYEDGPNTTSDSLTLVSTAPNPPTSITPASGTWGGDNSSMELNCSGASDNDSDTITYSIESNRTGSWTEVTTGLADGNYSWDISSYDNIVGINFRCWATDGALNSSKYTASASVNLDNWGPRWSSPSKNASTVYNGLNISLNTTWTETQAADVGLAGFIFSSNDSGSWTNGSYTVLNGTTNVSTYELEVTTSAGNTVGWYFWTNDTQGNTNQTDLQTFTIGNKSIAIAVSDLLDAGVRWVIQSLPSTRANASYNNGTSDTSYYVTVTSVGTNVDLSIAADGNLTTSGGSVLDISNEEFRYNTSETDVTNSDYYTMATTNNTIGSNIVNGTTSYMKFYLTVPGNQTVGIYNNTLSVYAEESSL